MAAGEAVVVAVDDEAVAADVLLDDDEAARAQRGCAALQQRHEVVVGEVQEAPAPWGTPRLHGAGGVGGNGGVLTQSRAGPASS